MNREETYDYVTEHQIQQALKRLGRKSRIRANAAFVLYVCTWAAMIYSFVSGSFWAGAGLLIGVLCIHALEVSARALFDRIEDKQLLDNAVKLLRKQMKEHERESQ